MSKKNKDIEVRVEEEKAQYNGANVSSKKVQQKIWTKPLKQLFVNGI